MSEISEFIQTILDEPAKGILIAAAATAVFLAANWLRRLDDGKPVSQATKIVFGVASLLAVGSLVAILLTPARPAPAPPGPPSEGIEPAPPSPTAPQQIKDGDKIFLSCEFGPFTLNWRTATAFTGQAPVYISDDDFGFFRYDGSKLLRYYLSRETLQLAGGSGTEVPLEEYGRMTSAALTEAASAVPANSPPAEIPVLRSRAYVAIMDAKVADYRTAAGIASDPVPTSQCKRVTPAV